VDAAYGGFFLLTERGQAALAGIERARSVTLDPHKGLFLPYGTGCLVVRDQEELRTAFRVAATYLPPEGAYDAADLSPELSREARGLRVWLPLKMHGAGAFRRLLDEKLDLAQHAAARLRGIPHLALEAPPELSLLAFRLCPPGHDGAQLDALNQRLLSWINSSQRVFLSGTRTREKFLLRLCILSFRTHQDRIDEALDLIERGAALLLEETSEKSTESA
jgi:aromatic-L-amino-acid decarboxylase